jgi:hypothetical protein
MNRRWQKRSRVVAAMKVVVAAVATAAITLVAAQQQ